MTTAVQHRRGTTAEHATFTGLEGEVTIDTTKDTAVIHDGVLAGGVPLARENLANVTPSGLAAITGASTASDDKFFIYDQSATTLKSITRAELNNAMEIDALANVTITGGTINGTTIGNTTAAAGTFTSITNTGGTANGVTYLNGSKVLTTGSALTYNGTSFGVGSSSYGDAGSISLSVGVAGSTTGGLQLFAGSAQEHYIQWGDATSGAGTYAGAISYSHASDFMRFWTSSTEQMRLTSTSLYTASGINVGIGLSSPSSKLDVSGVISLQGTTLPTAGTARLFSRSSDSGLYIQSATGGTTYLLDGSQNTMYAATSTSHQWSISNSIKLTLDSSGNLGLGVSPSCLGEVESKYCNLQMMLLYQHILRVAIYFLTLMRIITALIGYTAIVI
jgi:hypothetical protein